MKTRFLAAAVAVALPSLAAAQEVSLPPIVVTASRTAQTVDETLAAVTIVTREDIERIQPQTLLELMRLQPGVDIVRTGAPGSQTSIFLRGTNSDHTLVLIDGVRANSASTGGFPWQSLEPTQIERIEIVRGPRAALYGADAIGGVVQIFTRKPSGLNASASYGSNNTSNVQLGYGGGERVRYRLQGSFAKSDGVPSRTVSEQDHGYENRSLSAGLDVPLWGEARLSLDGWINRGESEYDEDAYDPNTFLPIGVVERRLETENRTVSVRLNDSLSKAWQYSLSVGHAYDENKTESGEISTNRLSADWQHTLALTHSQTMIFGVSYYHDAVDSQSWDVYDETADNKAGFISYLSQIGTIDLELSARHDNHSEYGGKTTGSAAAGVEVLSGVRLLLSHGTAFKAPTFNDLYSPGFGNLNLEPEESRSTELGLRVARGSHQLGVNLFHTVVDNLIVYAAAPPYRKSNVDEARIRGLEVQYALTAGAWHYGANATLQQARDRSDDSRLLRRPERKLSMVVGRTFKNNAFVNADGILVSESDDVGSVRLPGYGLLNLSASYPLGSGLRAFGRIENAFDKNYETAAGFNTLERTFYLGLSYSPGAR